MKILITGGAGYIGSTIASACLDASHEVVILDDLSAGRREFVRDLPFYEGDVGDQTLLNQVFTEHASDPGVADSLLGRAEKGPARFIPFGLDH